LANAREQYLQAMASFTEMTRARAEQLAGRLAKQGDLQSGQVGRFAEDLVRRTQRNRETMSRLIQREVKRQLSVLGIATRDEVARLQQRVRALEQAAERQAAASRTLRSGAAATGTTSTTGTTTRKSAASRSTASGTATRKPATSRSGAAGTGAAKPASATARKPASGTTGTTGTTGTSGGRRARGSPQTGQDRTEGE
jgi:polyhydroxyalkanoate synthesis regulator phasin